MSDYQALQLLSNLTDSSSSSTIDGLWIWSIIAFILSVAGSILLYFLFVKPKTELKGFAKKLKDFLDFKSLCIETLLKIFYYGSTFFIILTSINTIILGDVMGFFVQLLLIPIVLRLAYEGGMLLVRIWQNTSEIAGKKK